MSTQPKSTNGTHGTDLGAPPPLPGPGTGGREEFPSSQQAAGRVPLGQPEAAAPERQAGCGGGFGARLGKYLLGIGLLTAIWALGGGGYFWPFWAMIGWGFFVVFFGSQGHQGGRRPRRRATRPGTTW